MPVTDAQVRRMNEEYTKHNNLGLAAMRSGMDRKTARKYRDLGQVPSELKAPRTWRTRKDAFAEDWSWLEAMLADAPELEGKALFGHLLRQRPGQYQEGQLRTFQRRVRDWRARSGPPKEVFFPQQHRPGEAAQTDFTWANELEITIGGEPFPHLLCHVVLPYSNWQWATVCHSESLAALRRGVQDALFRLGRRPEWHQTDNSTSATHHLPDGKRTFNSDYEALMRHLGMKPRTTGIGKKEQNGDVESLNGALKRRLKQYLLLRGSRDFDSLDAYSNWLADVLEAANAARSVRVAEDLAAMTPLAVDRLPEWTEERVRVTSWSTIRVKNNTYSVPSRLIGERVAVRIYDDRIEVLHGARQQLATQRLHGRSRHRIDYRHIIWSLVRKPGAFKRYRYRDELFPSVVFRQAYDTLCGSRSPRQADLTYLRVLHLAASTLEADVELALECLLDAGEAITLDAVKGLVAPAQRPALATIAPLAPQLGEYDELLQVGGVR